MVTKEKIEMLEDGKVRISYVDNDLDIKNKKQKVVGKRSITYDAIYDSPQVAKNIFRQKIQEHKNNLKDLVAMIDKDKKDIEAIQNNIIINEATKGKIEEIINTLNDIIDEVDKLKQ